VGARKLMREFDEQLIPRLAVLTALALVLSTIMIPLPGGTSAHFIGIGLLAIAFGVWPAFIAFSLVLALQAVLLGAGGITALPVNALAMGWVGSLVCVVGHRHLRPVLGQTRLAPLTVVIPVWLGIVIASMLVALILGAQPAFGRDATGQPLFFPFGPAVTLPVIVLPHVMLGLLEGVMTWMVLSVLHARRLVV